MSRVATALGPVALLLSANLAGCSTGGAPGDFSGDYEECQSSSEVALDEVSPLGFSPDSILQFSEGEYATPVRWFSPCENPEGPCGSSDCPNAMTPQAAGTETTLRFTVERTGEEAIVKHGDSRCAQSMTIPVDVAIFTDDGLLNERFQTTLGTGTGEDSSVYAAGLVHELEGDLSKDDGVRAATRYEFDLFFYGEEAEASVYVVDRKEKAPLLVFLLPPYDTCHAVIETAE